MPTKDRIKRTTKFYRDRDQEENLKILKELQKSNAGGAHLQRALAKASSTRRTRNNPTPIRHNWVFSRTRLKQTGLTKNVSPMAPALLLLLLFVLKVLLVDVCLAIMQWELTGMYRFLQPFIQNKIAGVRDLLEREIEPRGHAMLTLGNISSCRKVLKWNA